METKHIRLDNMRQLIAKHASAADFARKVEIDPKQIHLYQKGIRNIGPLVARRIEKQLKLPNGWMDNSQTTLTPTVAHQELHDLLETVGSLAEHGVMSDHEITLLETFLASMVRSKTSRGGMSKEITTLQSNNAAYEVVPIKKLGATA
jgi:hypothetical protein